MGENFLRFLGFEATTSPFNHMDVGNLLRLLQIIMPGINVQEQGDNVARLIQVLQKMTSVKKVEECETELR